MKKCLLILGLFALVKAAVAQELFVNTEPASNMATRSLGIRLENQAYANNGVKNRSTLEVMYGQSKYLMLHASAYTSDYYTPGTKFEGVSTYAKYRFLSVDSVQSHFRGAAFFKASLISNPLINQEITLEGDNTGFQAGFVFTRLAHKLALSGSASYLHGINRGDNYFQPGFARDEVAYTLSAGYLLLPRVYENYNQTNMNVYMELLGKNAPGYGQSYLDAAPAVQLIFNSVFRVDLSYRIPVYNQMLRTSNNTFLIRLEYNLFNVF